MKCQTMPSHAKLIFEFAQEKKLTTLRRSVVFVLLTATVWMMAIIGVSIAR